MFSLDPKIADPDSAVRARHREYGKFCEELSIILLAPSGKEERVVEGAMTLYTPGKGSRGGIKTWARFLGDAIAEEYTEKGDGVVTSQDPFFVGYIAWQVARRAGLPLQLQLHTDIFAPEFYQESFKNKIRYWLARFLLARATGVRVVASKVKEQLVRRWHIAADKVSVLPVFVDVQQFQKQPSFSLKEKYPEFGKIVLVVSRLAREKRVDRAIDVFARLHKQHPDFGLIIVGVGPELENLQLKTKNYQLETAILFAGWQNDLVSYYKGADALLVTSDYEGYGMQIVEALASGCPVVSTDVGIAREAGALVARTDEELSQLLVRVLTTARVAHLSKDFEFSKEEYLSRFTDSLRICL